MGCGQWDKEGARTWARGGDSHDVRARSVRHEGSGGGGNASTEMGIPSVRAAADKWREARKRSEVEIDSITMVLKNGVVDMVCHPLGALRALVEGPCSCGRKSFLTADFKACSVPGWTLLSITRGGVREERRSPSVALSAQA